MLAAVTPARIADVGDVPVMPFPHHVVVNGSLAGAIKQGLMDSAPADEVIVIDAGGHDPLEHPRLLESDADLVIGSRFVKGGSHDGPRWRQVGSRVYGWWCSLVTMCPVKDWTSGYRLYRHRAIEVALSVDVAEGHAWQAAVVGECARHGLKIEEVPISYTPSSSALSIKRMWEAVRVWMWLWR